MMSEQQLQDMVDKVNNAGAEWASSHWKTAKMMCDRVCSTHVDDAVLDLIGLMIEALERKDSE